MYCDRIEEVSSTSPVASLLPLTNEGNQVDKHSNATKCLNAVRSFHLLKLLSANVCHYPRGFTISFTLRLIRPRSATIHR